MRVLSLFSGGGLGDYGLEKAGFEIVGQVEIEEYCQKILTLRWPEVPKYRDIREFDGIEFVRAHGPIDLISGGFPCQDISTAGRGAGIAGQRSGLWKEMLRVIREVRPRYVLVENVTALLGRGLGVVLGDLASIGYDTEWDCIPASALGAPHQRDRVWIVAYTSSPRGGGGKHPNKRGRKLHLEVLANPNGPRTQGPRAWSKQARGTKLGNSREMDNALCGRYNTSKKKIFAGRDGIKHSDWWAVEPNVGRVAHGVAKRVERLKLLGNGQVVQVVQYIGERIMAFEKEFDKQ